jgi:hypothetical protein
MASPAKPDTAEAGLERLDLAADAAPPARDRVRAAKPKPRRREPQSWALAGGAGWLYGMGCVCGPFFGVGVGLTVPGGIIAGAGGGVGIVVGIGMGGGLVWGAGRGSVAGMGLPTEMEPPELPSLDELTSKAAGAVESFQRWGGQLARGEIIVWRSLKERRRRTPGREEPSLALLVPPLPVWRLSGSPPGPALLELGARLPPPRPSMGAPPRAAPRLRLPHKRSPTA